MKRGADDSNGLQHPASKRVHADLSHFQQTIDRVESLVQQRDHSNLKVLQPQLETAIRGKQTLSQEELNRLTEMGIRFFNANRSVEDTAAPCIMLIACTLMNSSTQYNPVDAVALMRSYKKTAEALGNVADTDSSGKGLSVTCYDAAIHIVSELIISSPLFPSWPLLPSSWP
jgi:hypothetical protein